MRIVYFFGREEDEEEVGVFLGFWFNERKVVVMMPFYHS
jgi:hypothetical protein